MHIIIIGAGDVGYNLAKMLSYERHDIIIIENDSERYTHAVDGLDAQVYHASGTSFKILEQAGIKTADMLVSVTNSDEVNLLTAIMAKQYGVKKTIARVKNAEFLDKDSPINAEKFDIDLIIHPESETAEGAVALLKQSAASDILEFADGKIIMMGIQLDSDLPFLRKPLSLYIPSTIITRLLE